MGQCNFIGLEDVEMEILKESEKAEKVIPIMLKKGAEVLIKAQQKAISNLSLSSKSRGTLAKSIGATKTFKKSGGKAMGINVGPQGIDYTHNKKGVRNAEKGFVLEHGRSNMKARPWHSPAYASSENDIHETMANIWKDF